MAAAEVPPIMDINTAREYLGGISRAHLYRIMPDRSSRSIWAPGSL